MKKGRLIILHEKRRFETTDMNSDTDENKAPSLEAETNEETMIDDQVGSSISEAGKWPMKHIIFRLYHY